MLRVEYNPRGRYSVYGWTNSGRPNARLFQIEACQEILDKLEEDGDIFNRVLTQPKVPIYNCSKARFAGMCVCLSKGNHQ